MVALKDTVPYPWHATNAQRLFTILKQAYSDVSHAAIIATSTGMNLDAWNRHQSVDLAWHDLIDIAARQSKLRTLLVTVLNDQNVAAYHERIRELADSDAVLSAPKAPTVPGPVRSTSMEVGRLALPLIILGAGAVILLVAQLSHLSIAASPDHRRCPPGRQQYNEQCVSDEMIDFIVCLKSNDISAALLVVDAAIEERDTDGGNIEADGGRAAVSRGISALPPREVELVFRYCLKAASRAGVSVEHVGPPVTYQTSTPVSPTARVAPIDTPTFEPNPHTTLTEPTEIALPTTDVPGDPSSTPSAIASTESDAKKSTNNSYLRDGGEDRQEVARRLYMRGVQDRLIRKDYTTALKEFLLVNELEPENPKIQGNIALCLEALGRRAEAIQYYRAALKTSGNEELTEILRARLKALAAPDN